MKVIHLKLSSLRGRKKKRRKKNEQNLKDLRDTIKQINTCITGIPDGQKRKRQKIYLKKH